MPEAIPLDVNRSAGIAVGGLAYCAHKADSEHANGETEKGEKDTFFLAEPDLDMPEEGNRNGHEWRKEGLLALMER